MKAEHLKIEVVTMGRAGGQQVGDAPVGVRVMHIPTGLIAVCDHERSQMKNRTIATAMIEWGLAELKWEDPT